MVPYATWDLGIYNVYTGPVAAVGKKCSWSLLQHLFDDKEKYVGRQGKGTEMVGEVISSYNGNQAADNR